MAGYPKYTSISLTPVWKRAFGVRSTVLVDIGFLVA